MKDKTKLYFDVWRKAGFKNLLKAYVQTFSKYNKESIIGGFAEQLDLFVDGGRGTYQDAKDWRTAYIIARELAVYKEYDDSYQLSKLALDYLRSKITSAEYLANYLLNFNDLINGVVVHPLKEVLGLFSNGTLSIDRERLKTIVSFGLTGGVTRENANQTILVFCNRIAESKLLNYDELTKQLSLSKYNLIELQENCCVWTGSVKEFALLDHNGYVNMIVRPNPLVYGGIR